MFRFDIIESEKEIVENQLIDLVTKKMRCFQRSEDQKGSIYILVRERESLKGGACLVRRNLKNIQEDVRELVMTHPLQNYVWECSTVCLELPQEQSVKETSELRYSYHSFYRGLYEGFVEFGKMKGVGFLIMKLSPEVYDATKEFGLWPYVVELKPDNSLDGLFHGVLPLTGSQYRAYRESWEVA
ncbi:MAG: hypothetical protein BGO67_02435 [Alphaproteobacteria bacterium 41-28]|nr:MAG: hypothetical protein BGO67_02435 [Alphaproteobacteria bacterium 41-28]